MRRKRRGNEFINYWILHIASVHGWTHKHIFSKLLITPFPGFFSYLRGEKKRLMGKISSKRIFQYWQLSGEMGEKKKERGGESQDKLLRKQKKFKFILLHEGEFNNSYHQITQYPSWWQKYTFFKKILS